MTTTLTTFSKITTFRWRVSVFIVLSFGVLSGFSVAEAGPSCRDLFIAQDHLPIYFNKTELNRPPQDGENGWITDRVAITVDTLVAAYRKGIFPYDVTPSGLGVWFNPPKRGVLEFSELSIGSSDRKVLRKLEEAVARGEIRVTFDQAFDRVIRACAEMKRLRRNPTTGELANEGTWISQPIIDGYNGLHKVGRGHSVEIWRGDQLVAGAYGVVVKGVFSGESMFHTEPEVAKLAFFRLIEHLKSQGFTWMDTQVAPPDSTSLSVKWGAKEVPRREFLRKQREAARFNRDW